MATFSWIYIQEHGTALHLEYFISSIFKYSTSFLHLSQTKASTNICSDHLKLVPRLIKLIFFYFVYIIHIFTHTQKNNISFSLITQT